MPIVLEAYFVFVVCCSTEMNRLRIHTGQDMYVNYGNVGVPYRYGYTTFTLYFGNTQPWTDAVMLHDRRNGLCLPVVVSVIVRPHNETLESLGQLPRVFQWGSRTVDQIDARMDNVMTWLETRAPSIFTGVPWQLNGNDVRVAPMPGMMGLTRAQFQHLFRYYVPSVNSDIDINYGRNITSDIPTLDTNWPLDEPPLDDATANELYRCTYEQETWAMRLYRTDSVKRKRRSTWSSGALQQCYADMFCDDNTPPPVGEHQCQRDMREWGALMNRWIRDDNERRWTKSMKWNTTMEKPPKGHYASYMPWPINVHHWRRYVTAQIYPIFDKMLNYTIVV